jgi:hypothetical protein
LSQDITCSHKDYSSFLGDKLTVFNFCNYGIVLAKVSYDFGFVLDYFVIYEAYFIGGEFFVELLVLRVLFYCLCLILLFVIRLGQ